MNTEDKKHSVHRVKSDSEFDEIIRNASESNITLFIKFGATWCGPCKRIQPCYEALSTAHNTCAFISIDVDTVSVGERYGITALPTFIVFKNNHFTVLMKGSNEARLVNLVQNSVTV